MKFCSQCGASVNLCIPSGDNRPRYVCAGCDTIHYQNPKIVAGCIPEWQGRVLLCRRAIRPRYGLWTLPAGFMELGESTIEAAARETLEEANAIVDELTLFGVYHLPHIDQVYIMFRGQLRDGQASPGQESLEVELFAEQDIPWEDLAFTVIDETLRSYFQYDSSEQHRVYMGDILRKTGGRISIRRY